ncbi:MAG: hypothetical protein ACRCXC_02550 [Legionella sp.]
MIASLGIAWLDQSIAIVNGRYPVEIDLVRNVRYLIPLLLIGAIQFLAYLNLKIPASYRPAFCFLIVVITVRWFFTFPSTVSGFMVNKLKHSHRAEDPVNNRSNRTMLNYIKKLPEGSKIMAFPQQHMSDDVIEFFMFSVRYASLHPVAHLKKDLNFLSYSGSGLQILEWQK